MSQYIQLISAMEGSDEYAKKSRIVSYLIRNVQGQKIAPADKQALAEMAFRSVEELLKAIPAAENYKTKDAMFDFEDKLLGLVMALYSNAKEIPEEKILLISELVSMVEQEQILENEVNKLFGQETIYVSYVERLLSLLAEITDEYQRGMLYPGLLHYKDKISKIPEEGRSLLADYIASEIDRYLKGDLSEDVLNNLEIAADVCKYFATDAVVEGLYGMLKLGRGVINYYAMDTLLSVGREVPTDVVAALANNLTYADMTYHSLKKHGKESAFPAELATEEYLAKSDLVHWLTYPTELGKEPDQIEYLGKTKVKKEVFHIFRYLSDSDNLDDELKNQWLIGWSGNEGGTFSQFDLYAPFEKKTPEKTVKYIKKKLL